MNKQISLPVKYIDKDGNSITQNLTTTFVENVISEDKFISSMQYVPDFQQNADLFKDAAKLLDVLVKNEANDAVLREINQAYCDTLYKWSAYNKLSYGAKITLLEEKGFDYILDLLLHMYDDEYLALENEYNKELIKYQKGEISEKPTIESYESFVEKNADATLTRLVQLFNLINTLKGKTLGLELVLDLLDIPDYLFLPWNVVALYKGEWQGKIDDLPMPKDAVSVKVGDCYSKTFDETVNYYIFNGVSWHPCNNYTDYLTPREPLTAILEIFGGGASTENLTSDLQKRLNRFVKSYMLPLIDVTIKFTTKMTNVYAFPSGVYQLYRYMEMLDYYHDAQHIQKDLVHNVSDEHWYYSDMFTRRDLFFGIPESVTNFSGSVSLPKSYVKDAEGNIHYLYGTAPTLSEVIFGSAVEKIDSQGYITNYNGEFLQVPLEQYIDIDFVTCNQQNPHYVNGEFYRDTLIRYYKCLTVGGIHLAKTVEQMMCYYPTAEIDNPSELPSNPSIGDCYKIRNRNDRYLFNGRTWVLLSYPDLLVEDFEKEYEYEVYLGMSTTINCQSGKDYREDIDDTIDSKKALYNTQLLDEGIPQKAIDNFVDSYKVINSSASYYKRYAAQQVYNEMLDLYPLLSILVDKTFFYDFTYNEPVIRKETGVETTHLVFCEDGLDVNYTGIGDLGILGANDYFIYNGMLMYHDDKLKQVGEDKTWTDVGASHAVSEMYYTPAINNGQLYYIYKGTVDKIQRDEHNLDAYVSYIVKHPQMIVDVLGLESNQELEEELIRTFVESWYEIGAYWDEVEYNKWTHITGYVNDYYTAFGICEGRLYKLSKNPYYGQQKADGTPEPLIVYQIMDDEQGWEYVTGAAYSETYEAYGIKSEKLYRLSANGITEVTMQNGQRIVGIDHVVRTLTENSDKFVYDNLSSTDMVELGFNTYIEVNEFAEEYTLKELTSIKFNDVSLSFTENEGVFTADNIIVTWDKILGVDTIKISQPEYDATLGFTEGNLNSFVLNENIEIVGWSKDFDCISRYHHCNSDYTTYGICDGKLYAINNTNISVLDDSKVWTSVCGFYNENSPRTFAYALADGKLYELKGLETPVEYKNSETENLYWSEIHGCTTATNNFVLGIAKTSQNDVEGYIYKINAKTLSKLDDRKEWVECFGRYTTSVSASNNCYGYGVRLVNDMKKLYQFTKDGISIISGFWKVDGTGDIVELSNYDITSIKANMPDGTSVVGEQSIKEVAPYNGTSLSDYDIFVAYTTKGFNNNERYRVRTEMTEENYTYINPSLCRYEISEDNCVDMFDTQTGLMGSFIKRNINEHGADIINGDGIAALFLEKESYLSFKDSLTTEAFITFECTCEDENTHPLIMDANSRTGIFYGYYNGKYGIILIKEENGNLYKEVILELNKNETRKTNVKYLINGDYANIYIENRNVFNYSIASNSFVYKPLYLGGNGMIFSEGMFYLAESYMVTREGRIALFENGNYLSLHTQNQDLIEVLQTDATQHTSKVIEVIKSNDEKIELSMDILYTQMMPECTTQDLIVTTDYNVNTLKSDNYEGTTQATLTYAGAYELDNEKIRTNVPLSIVPACDFADTGIASHLNESYIVMFDLSTSVTTPIYVRTGDNVGYQRLYKTEENEAYANKYLLQSEVTADSDVSCRAVPSGIIYELNSDEPKTVSRTLVYNNERFDINPERIYNYTDYSFDSYRALLYYYPLYETIFDEETMSYKEIYLDRYSTILLKDDIIADSHIEGSYKFKITSTKADEEFLTIDDRVYSTLGEQDYYYKLDYTRDFVDLNRTVLQEINPDTAEEKDKLHYYNGQCWNYSNVAYQIMPNVLSNTKIILCVLTDDDASKDQGIFGGLNKSGFGIKDNRWSYTDNAGTVIKSSVEVLDNVKTYVRFDISNGRAYVYVSEDRASWTPVFDNVIMNDNSIIGYANVGGEMLPFNGRIDLAQSYIENSGDRLYIMSQSTVVSVSENGETWTNIETIETPYTISEIYLGHYFSGTLDCYYSDLLKSYDLGWVYNRVAIDTAVKQELQASDPDYDIDKDENVYGLEEYGIYLESEPKRWDEITVTYTTVDKAFYMEDNHDYILQMNVIDDHESGKTSVETVGTPSWNGGVVSDFANGYCTYDFPYSGYSVFKITLDGDNQAIFSYNDENDTTPPCIFVQNGVVKYFDDVTIHELFTVTQNDVYIKLYTDYSVDREIEYSLDGINFISTGVTANFTGYEKFALGRGHINGDSSYFNGSIDLTKSYYCTGSLNNYSTPIALFTYYKKIIPFIVDGGVNYPLTLEPLLTVRDYVEFAPGWNGEIYLYKSDLTLGGTHYWEANQIRIYEKDEFGEKGLLRDTIIRDAVSVEDKYIVEEERVHVIPDDLQAYIAGTPKIGSEVVLTYETWYMFREKNAKYNFKITYLDNEALISYKKVVEDDEDNPQPEYVIYRTEKQDLVVNTGFQFNGVLVVYESTRGGMPLCDHKIWHSFAIKYKKYSDETWELWNEFILEKSDSLYERIGYDLKGIHYLPTSWVKTDKIETPFVSFYNNEYIKPIGGLSFTEDGEVSSFSDTSYLAMIMDKLHDGYTVSFFITTNDNEDQDICTYVKGLEGYFVSEGGETLNKFRPNYHYIVQYIFGSYGITVHDVDVMKNANLEQTLVKMFSDGENSITVRILGYNIGDISYIPIESSLHYTTVIPYNPNKKEGATAYYIETAEQASRVAVSYRKIENDYDHFTEEGSDIWYDAPLELQEVEYCGKKLNIYAAKVPFGNGQNPNFTYYIGDNIEFRVKSNTTSYNTIIPYNSLVYRQRAVF